MSLQIGDIQASSGMSKAIFDQFDSNLMTQDAKNKLKPEDLAVIREGWKKLAYSIAKGVIDHLESNVSGNTGEAVTTTNSHVHKVKMADL